MVIRLLSAFAISICLVLITAQLQPAFAQKKPQSSGYLHLMTRMLIAKKQIALPIATPTIYTRPIVPLPSPTPIKSLAKRSTTVSPTKAAKPSASTEGSILGDAMAFIMSEINKYRSEHGLGAVQTSAETCTFAAMRASEIVSNFSHDGFQSRIDSKTLPYTSWSSVTENIAMTTNYTEVVTMWANSPGHAENMRADTPFVCVRQSGNYYAYVGMKP